MLLQLNNRIIVQNADAHTLPRHKNMARVDWSGPDFQERAALQALINSANNRMRMRMQILMECYPQLKPDQLTITTVKLLSRQLSITSA